jgi:hypothetical protein
MANPAIEELSLQQRRELLKKLLRTRAEQNEADFPLSVGQRALWFIHRLAPQSFAYNTVTALRFTPSLDIPRLQEAMDGLVKAHDLLRSAFPDVNGTPVQRVIAEARVMLETVDAACLSESELYSHAKAALERPFDLASGPPMRVVLFQREHDQLLVIVVHHIAVDGWSGWILLDELRVRYECAVRGESAPPSPKRRYRDRVAMQAAYLNGPEGAKDLEFWRSYLSAPLPVLSIAADYERPAIPQLVGSYESVVICPDLTVRIRQLANTECTTVYTVLLTAYAALLQKYSSQQEFVIGMPVAGREDGLFDDVIGYFINVVPLRIAIDGAASFHEAVKNTRRQVLTTLAHAQYPFSSMVEQLRVERHPSRSPVFQTTFNLLRPHASFRAMYSPFASTEITETPMFGNSRMTLYPLRQEGGSFELSLEFAELGDTITGQLNYATDLFRPATATHMAESFMHLLKAATKDPDRAVRELSAERNDDREDFDL